MGGVGGSRKSQKSVLNGRPCSEMLVQQTGVGTVLQLFLLGRVSEYVWEFFSPLHLWAKVKCPLHARIEALLANGPKKSSFFAVFPSLATLQGRPEKCIGVFEKNIDETQKSFRRSRR